MKSDQPATVAPGIPRNHSYGQILKSTALIGGSSMLNVAAGIVRSKVVAVLLGPAGFGLTGLYLSIVNFAESIAGMGVNTAGVRQIAAAVGSGESERIARTAQVLRWSSWALGLLGALLLFALSPSVARLTFDDDARTLSVALLSLAVLFRTVSAGQGALIQGLRRISDLAKISVVGGISGTLVTIALVYGFGQRGIVPALIAVEAVSLLLSWWFSRKVQLVTVALRVDEASHEAASLLKLGFAFMASGMVAMGSAYAVRIMIVRQLGIDAAGLYQSAWMVGGLYVGFVLQAMGADFYPRLTAVILDNEQTNRLVNEQAQISLLLAVPGVLATLTFAPLVLPLFYSMAFKEAVELLRWLCLGVALRVVTWPLGFIIVASGKQGVFLAVELAYALVYLALAWTCMSFFGLNGAGVAFFGSYVFHGLMLYPVVRLMSGFRWSAANKRLAIPLFAIIATVFGGFYVLPFGLAIAVGSLAVLATTFYSTKTVVRLVSPDRLPSPVIRIAGWLGFSTSPGR